MPGAKQAAGENEVSVHGAAVAQLARRPASAIGLDPEHIEPERVRVLDGEHA